MKNDYASLAFFLAYLFLALFSSCASGSSNWSEEKELQLQALRQELTGTLVYERDEKIYKTELGSLEPVYLADGTYPRWSPDGQYVAFLQGNALMRVPLAGGESQLLTSVETPRAIVYHPNGQEIWFTDGDKVQAYNITNRTVITVLADFAAREIDLSQDGRRLIATTSVRGSYAVIAVELATGMRKRLDTGCSSSLSPDGALITSNTSNHQTLLILSWDTGKPVGEITAQGDEEYDNQFWSNSPRWITAVGQSSGDIFVQNTSDNRSIQVSAVGNASHADLFVR